MPMVHSAGVAPVALLAISPSVYGRVCVSDLKVG